MLTDYANKRKRRKMRKDKKNEKKFKKIEQRKIRKRKIGKNGKNKRMETINKMENFSKGEDKLSGHQKSTFWAIRTKKPRCSQGLIGVFVIPSPMVQSETWTDSG